MIGKAANESRKISSNDSGVTSPSMKSNAPYSMVDWFLTFKVGINISSKTLDKKESDSLSLDEPICLPSSRDSTSEALLRPLTENDFVI